MSASGLPRSLGPLQSLVESRRHEKLGRASIVFRQAQRTDSIYYLESGLVKLTHRLDDGRDFLVRLASAGEIFGENILFSNEPASVTAEAMRESVVHEFPRAEFLDLCARNPEIWQWVASLCRRRLDDAERRLQLVSFYRVEQRILMVLSSLAPVFEPESENNILVPLSQSELANLVGATRETTSTTLNLLERRGLLRLGRRNLTILSSRALESAWSHSRADAAMAGD